MVSSTGVIIKTSCSFWSGSGACSPPSCAAGWTEVGSLGATYSAANSAGAMITLYRNCLNPFRQKNIESSCMTWGGASCTPPACPSGWFDLSDISFEAESANSSGAGGRYFRNCVK